MPEYSRHQKRIIERYYDRRDEIMLARLSEIVSDLYIHTNEKKLKQLWSRAEKAMKNLKVPPDILAHILEKQETELLARHLRRWLDDANRQKGK